MLLNESFIRQLTAVLSLFSAVLCSVCELLLLHFVFGSRLDSFHLIMLTMLGGVVGLGVCYIVLEQIWASAVTLLVCMKDSPKQFEAVVKEFSLEILELADMSNSDEQQKQKQSDNMYDIVKALVLTSML